LPIGAGPVGMRMPTVATAADCRRLDPHSALTLAACRPAGAPAACQNETAAVVEESIK
jgi:hypothetical protein